MTETPRSIIVVGAGPGVGREVARRFGRAGYRVGLIRRDPERLRRMLDDLVDEGIDARGIAADASQSEQLTAAITTLAASVGGIDVLHHAVPGPLADGYGPALDMPLDVLSSFLHARLISALAATQAAMPYLRASQGTALFTSGASDREPYPGTAAIGAPQAALRMLALHLHDELAPEGVHVGYLPLPHPPLYSDEAEEHNRTDLPAGFAMAERITAARVAEAHFELAQTRDRFEMQIGLGALM